MSDDMHVVIETYQGIPITLNLATGSFYATVPRGYLQADRLLVLHQCIRQSLLLERELASCAQEEAPHA